jgi:uncharacterized protein (DUF1778 family)
MTATGATREDRIEWGRAERIVLSERDTLRLFALLEAPHEPSPALVARRRTARG